MNTPETLLKSGKSLSVLKPGKKLKQQEEKPKAVRRFTSDDEEFDKACARGVPYEESMRRFHAWAEDWKQAHDWENRPGKDRHFTPEEAEDAFDKYFASEEYLEHAKRTEELIWGKR
jgi:hypothetical protein